MLTELAQQLFDKATNNTNAQGGTCEGRSLAATYA